MGSERLHRRQVDLAVGAAETAADRCARLATRHPEWVAGLIIQNANAYQQGLSGLARQMSANRPGVSGAEHNIRRLLELPATRSQYQSGASSPELIAPDGWTLDQHFLETAVDQAEALAILRAAQTAVVWSYISPPPVHLVPGEKTGRYRAEARDTPLVDEHGESRISVGDYAAAVVDTVENGSFARARFTVAY